ncbi:DDE-type integrase/transposase/recombinase [Salibacterium halotolerans]|uniref:DDE-type integrase/transposase/recombinase n=1 Tax=Salibacterium halotolerans TaxID=1884432 RepID=UPI003CC79DB0
MLFHKDVETLNKPYKSIWIYPATIMNLFSRKITGWNMASHITKELVLPALDRAFITRFPGPRLLLHSDRGSQYCSKDYTHKLKAYDNRSL